jgi:chromosome segregation ATPase
MIDILNTSKKVFKNGISGTIILGEKLNRIFTALPEHYSFTDFDIHITDSSEIKREQEIIKQLTSELTKGGALDPEIIIEVVTASGLTKMKTEVLKALEKKREENNQIQQLTDQVKQYETQLQQLQQELQKSTQKIQQLDERKVALEKEQLEFEKELGWYKEKSEAKYKDSMLELEKKRIELEAIQLIDTNINNNEIKNT